MKNKYKHMDYIQSAISRMASNSFYLKGWNVTIIAAIVALSFKESDWRIYACVILVHVITFGGDGRARGRIAHFNGAAGFFCSSSSDRP